MATGTVANTNARAESTFGPLAILKALGSLKLTVTLFGLAIFIIFVGTIAQDDLDLASVKRQFFTCWIAMIPFDVFAPRTLFPHDGLYLENFGFYFPGGASIGLLLLINLIAAKATRFGIHASGARLAGGILVSLLGAALITLVVMSGHTTDGLQGKPPIEYGVVWTASKAGLVLLAIALTACAFTSRIPKLGRVVGGVSGALLLVLCGYLLANPAVSLDTPGLRIVWQLVKATVASSVLLVGLIAIFGNRGGNVLIHLGVGLLMVGQFVFGDRQIEQRIGLAEGESTNLVVIESEIEIALIDVSDPNEDKVYAIGEPLIRRYEESDELIESPELPVSVRVIDWMQNSKLVPIGGPNNSEENTKKPKVQATAGLGLTAYAVPRKLIGGAIMDDRNIASAYVELIDKESDESLGTFLLSQYVNDIGNLTVAGGANEFDRVEIDGVPYDIGLRFRQLRKPYDVKLEDVQRIDYSGTETPRDYSSRIVITDRETGESQAGKTWMNNPIRYRGETFYQSRYNMVGGVETTGLQVVKNAGWVIPYVCCMMVAVGMLAHFTNTFVRFASRHARGALPGMNLFANKKSSILDWLAGVAMLGFCAIVALLFAMPKTYERGQVDWGQLATLPVQHEGRIKPLDTVARNVLQVIAQPTFGATPKIEDADGNRHEPSEWILSVMAGLDWVDDVKIFRIYSQEMRDLFDLEQKRKGYRYAYSELRPKLPEFQAEVAKLREKGGEDLNQYEERVAGVHRQLNLYDLIRYSYQLPPLADPMSLQTEEEQRAFMGQLMEVAQLMERLEQGGPPSMIPPKGDATKENLVAAKWQTLGPAVFGSLMSQLGLQSGQRSPALLPLDDLFTALRDGDAKAINDKASAYRKVVAGLPLAEVHMDKAASESWLNRFNPTAQGVVLYLLAAVMGLVGFMLVVADRGHTMQRATFWLLVGVFVIHTIAIIARIYVSGRAPVINLYSSAVFIGWACVLLALVCEWIYPLGIANLMAALIGASTLSVARGLDTSDTLHVLQAVLDTPFWLSTHVITVTAGYAVTFLAGFIALGALVHRVVVAFDSYPPGEAPKQSRDVQDVFYRMTYGVLCFAIFFSFVGTVLGGLWADDSWGRFWGWDPKENGALMIVMWNALILHARWDRMVGMRGFAILAVLGNIVTAWSWFGTNQLGIGLHSYGFTSAALITLVAFVSFNLICVAAALVITYAQGASNRIAKS
ncbi:MAG TPA: cytochrome C biogenesis protein [Planctomycetaceae bacterium]|nr:cytochrome C biogenesis protein [Planctomycetaceae bacterium]